MSEQPKQANGKYIYKKQPPPKQTMKQILFIILLYINGTIYAQENVDTLYYNRLGKIAANTLFAEYYRIALYPADSTCQKEFKDFYNSGELRKEGYFLSISSFDDSETVFDGEVRSYFRNGNISEKSHYDNGRLHGEYARYNDNGKLVAHAFYQAGELSGTCKTFNEDGSCQIVEYDAGKPIHDYYLLSDGDGNTLKFRITDNTPIWESPAITERFVDYRDGTPWEVYFKNGITIALTNSVIKDYGKWHRIDLIISNNSTMPIEFTPEFDISAYSTDAQGLTTYAKVWAHDEYLKKVNRAQTWMAIAVGISEGIASAGAGYSTSTTSGYSNRTGHFSYTTTTYNASTAYQANLASQQRIANFSQALQDEKNIKQMGYLKKNTIYPGESVSGYVHVERIKGKHVIFVINIKGAEYIYEWDFDRKNAFLPYNCR